MEQLKLHISDEDFRLFHENRLSDEETDALLTHTAHCTFCADRLAKSFEDAGLYRAPDNFKEAVLTKTEKLSQTPALPVFSKRQQWFFYSAKICAAMGLALFVLFSLPNMSFTESTLSASDETADTFTVPEPSFTERLNTSLNSAAASVNEQMNTFLYYNPLEEEH